jgi:hypothetical protein
MSTNTCLCSHPASDHASGTGHCLLSLHPACGCDRYRAAPSVADRAESWLAAREGSGIAPTEKAG